MIAMPGILENMAEQLRQLQEAVSQLKELVQAQTLAFCPMLPEEEVWADGPLSMDEACEFLRIKKSKLDDLIRMGELVSMKDGRRLIAKRGCIRYLVKHQGQLGRVEDDGPLGRIPPREKPAPKGKPKK
ncbi:MAG: helix-turn-helix domain-containing protein [Planctomycetes bacterium]|nr:helix-turn-helix domain-containing protein [Planctomycetota bacterium]